MLENKLEEYKKITEFIIKNISNKDVDFNSLMDKREKIITELIDEKNTNLELIKEIYISKGLLDLDRKLKVTIEEEQAKVKEEIRKIHTIRNANKAYENNKKINSFFNRKI
ncbi:flagellar protein FliT [Clostridium isatidis]|uniref:Flagellar protein FliT n=1 Tax=Clostridium isatidis TaxID=182773 RepID=A0A343JC62_9CLOT|nr:flagellar protein FliT [Clostridium isatidis]ASW43120.1 hypothetical protein BEN51_06390 [Clostridium isatidis]